MADFSEKDTYRPRKRKENFEDDSFFRSKNHQRNNKSHGSKNIIFDPVAKPSKPRKYTFSIAVPASILDETSIKDELRTYVVGQIARAAIIYSIDEIIVFDDGCTRDSKAALEKMKVLLEYQELPQYLRKYFFGFDKNLRCVGVLNPLNSPHHLKSNQWCEYREGVTLEESEDNYSYADVGLSKNVLVDQNLQKDLRITVKFPHDAMFNFDKNKKIIASVVSPDEPRTQGGYYWGYSVRLAKSLSEVVTGCTYSGGYDLIIGTSDKGDDAKKVNLPEFSHALIAFGGVQGLEVAIDRDSKLHGSKPRDLFHYYVNTCLLQQANTIRTEEAVLISLCVLHDKLVSKGIQ